MSSGFVVGSIVDDAASVGRGGWLLGSFFDAEGSDAARYAAELKVKYWEYQPGQEGSHSPKVSATLEWSFVISGSTTALLGGDEVTLHAGDYVVIHPGTSNNLVHRVREPIRAITVKAPSDPSAKRIVGA